MIRSVRRGMRVAFIQPRVYLASHHFVLPARAQILLPKSAATGSKGTPFSPTSKKLIPTVVVRLALCAARVTRRWYSCGAIRLGLLRFGKRRVLCPGSRLNWMCRQPSFSEICRADDGAAADSNCMKLSSALAMEQTSSGTAANSRKFVGDKM